ncbi:hypothetical protein GWI33_015949 [Rhynchophorus ferrugineus]|uniref:Leucine-rich repeat-containing protein 27 n=1 Tax=Rhynchophorus ferrugineus TaxID=354439 RepID=A0A834M964_RHYFE|nr:hypothetical protein GWI33_015949 [Rhynchophorus ferrugineus]
MSFDIISDYSKVDLTEIPENVLRMTNLKMLFLERNLLTTLPDDFFHKLPHLMWLDLRNNSLVALPKSIAHHLHLEHLLLTNNNIKTLPNELGLVPNLKALQVADNPLVYPPKKITQEGTKAIKKFLREQYERDFNHNQLDNQKSDNFENRDSETLLKVHNEDSGTIGSFDKNNNQRKSSSNTGINQKILKTKTRSNNTRAIHKLQKKLSDPRYLQPMLRVKKLEYPANNTPISSIRHTDEPLKIIHNIDKTDSKIRLKSYFNRADIAAYPDRNPGNSLKEGWLNKLRILLNDQERILQQERNLNALTSWRQKAPPTTKKFYEKDFNVRQSEIPFATYPEYAKIPSREELTAQLQTFLQQSDILSNQSAQSSKLNLDKLINDLVEQLKEMEISYTTNKSPRSEMQEAGQQIQTIVDIHKKLIKLRTVNEFL